MLKKRFSIVTVIIACICSCGLVIAALIYGLQSVTGSLPGTFKFLRALSIVRGSFIKMLIITSYMRALLRVW